MVKARSIIIAVALASLCAAATSGADSTASPNRRHSALGRFSFGVPTGWQLDPATGYDARYLLDPEHSYFMHPVGRSSPRAIVQLRAESVTTPAAAQSLEAIRLRSGVLDARENEISRSQFAGGSGLRIWKADYRTSDFPAHKVPLPIHTVLYSYRGPDSRVYTILCWPSPGSRDDFEAAWDELARTIKF